MTTEKLWKLMKNVSHFILLKALFILKIIKFLSWDFGHVENMVLLEQKSKFENSLSIQFNIAQYLAKLRQPDNEFCSVNRIQSSV